MQHLRLHQYAAAYLLLKGLYARVPVFFLLLQLGVQQAEFASQFTPLTLQAIQRLHQPVNPSLCPYITARLT